MEQCIIAPHTVYGVTLKDPIERGLKAPFRRFVDQHCILVTLKDPIERGLKAVYSAESVKWYLRLHSKTR